MPRVTTVVIATLSTLIAYIAITGVLRAWKPSLFIWSEEDVEEKEWLATSNSWLDRKACRWFGLCGVSHVRLVRPSGGNLHQLDEPQQPSEENDEYHPDWTDLTTLPEHWSPDEQLVRDVPKYVLEYAPLVHLFSEEEFWPGDIAEHLEHVTPQLNYTPISAQWQHPTLQDLDQLNKWQRGRHVFLTSNDNPEDHPDWLSGWLNVPEPGDGGDIPDHSDPDLDRPPNRDMDEESDDDREKWYSAGDSSQRGGAKSAASGYEAEGDEYQQHVDELKRQFGGHVIEGGGPRKGGRSKAPAVLVVVDKGKGVVDAFWFYFYSFNLGNSVLNVRFGNHVGDWEHCMVRFYKSEPKALFFSAHTAGEAYSYEAVEKIGKRPVIYSATGTHAMYATPGIHEYVLPWGLLHDQTDRGPLWDPLYNTHSYTYNYKTDVLRASTISPTSPTEWFYFNGRWGDKFYALGDKRQYRFAGQYHYVNGPLGPRFKHLGRRKMCQGADRDPCVIRNWIGDDRRKKRWIGVGTGEGLQDEDLQAILDRRAAALASSS